MTSFSDKALFNQTGEIISGISYFTTMPQYKLNIWDRITNFHSQIRYSEIVTKGAYGHADSLKFAPLKVVICRSVSHEYIYKHDFLFDTDKRTIDWGLHGIEPEVGEQYTVDYQMHPSWLVVDPTNIIRDTYTKSKKPGITYQALPQRVTVRLEYFLND